MIRTRLQPVAGRGQTITIIGPPRAPIADPVVCPECPECPECPPPGTTPPINEWVDLVTLAGVDGLSLRGITLSDGVFTVAPIDDISTVSIRRVSPEEPTGPSKGLLCVLVPLDPAAMLANLWAITTDNGLYLAEYLDHVSIYFLNTTFFLTGQAAPYTQDDEWVINQVFSAYQKDGGVAAGDVQFRIKAIEIEEVPLP